MDPPWQTGGAQQAHAHLKKATHAQAFLVHASSRKFYARARHRSPGPTIARVDRSRCPAGRTRVGSAHSRGAYHRLSHHPYAPEGPRDLASTPVIQRAPLRHLLLAHPACEEESVPEMVCTGQLVSAPVAPTATTGRPPG